MRSRVRLAALMLLVASCAPAGAGPHVILVSIDTLRADHVGLYGHGADTTPRIDRFFEDGTRFTQASSSAPCTIPAVRQMLLGAFDDRPERRSLAEILREAGYRTAAIVSQQQFHLGPGQYTRGFDHFDVQDQAVVDHHGFTARDAGEVTARALEWLHAHADAERAFLWLHYYDPHDPYSPPPEFGVAGSASAAGDPRSTQLRVARPRGPRLPEGLFEPEEIATFAELYEGEIRYVDSELGRIFDALDALGWSERSIVVLTSDHGEWLGEGDRLYHCKTLRETELHVPFLVRVNGGPLRPAADPSRPSSTLDILPTVVGLLGLPGSTAAYHGLDLRDAPADRVVAAMWSDETVVRRGDWKLVYRVHEPKFLYHVARDPEERWNQIADEEEVVDALDAAAAPYLALKDEIRMDKMIRALERIGYIQ